MMSVPYSYNRLPYVMSLMLCPTVNWLWETLRTSIQPFDRCAETPELRIAGIQLRNLRSPHGKQIVAIL